MSPQSTTPPVADTVSVPRALMQEIRQIVAIVHDEDEARETIPILCGIDAALSTSPSLSPGSEGEVRDDQWKPISEAPQDERVFLAALWHSNTRFPRWEYALLWWTEGRLRFYEEETGWEPGEYTLCFIIPDPKSTHEATGTGQSE